MSEGSGNMHPAERLGILYKSFSSTFMTLISIVQGAVFGYFALIVGENFHDFDIARWLLGGATFLVIIIMWHETMMTTSIFQGGIIRMRESIVFFFFGALEFIMVRVLGTDVAISVWFFVAAISNIVAVVLIMMAYSETKAEGQSQDILDKFDRRLRPIFSISCMIALICFGLLTLFIKNAYLTTSLSALSLLMIIALLWLSSHYWGSVIQYLKDIAKLER